MIKALVATAALIVLIVGSPPADAKGCIKGAIVGGAAGHMAGEHGLLGAGAGCLVGRHYANKREREQERQRIEQQRMNDRRQNNSYQYR